MKPLQRITNILGAGSYANFFLPKLGDGCIRLGATPSILTMGRYEFNRATASEPTRFDRDGIVDVSPSPDEILNALGNANSDEIAESNRPFWEPPTHAMILRVVQALARARLVDGQTLWVQGLRTGHRKPAEEGLRELKARQPRQFIVAASTLPEDFDKRDRLRDGHDLFYKLWEEKIIETTILVDNASLFARAYSLDVQDRYQATALASLLAAQLHFGRNSSLAEIARSLGDYAAYLGLAFASRSIPVGREIPWWRMLRKGISWLPQRGSASLDSVILETQSATRLAVSDPSAAAIEEAVNLDLPFTIIYTVPLPRVNQVWIDFSRELRCWLANTYPKATPVFASGNGTPAPRFPGDYWVQASVLYPLPDVPAPIKGILERRSLHRRRPTAKNLNGSRDPGANQSGNSEQPETGRQKER